MMAVADSDKLLYTLPKGGDAAISNFTLSSIHSGCLLPGPKFYIDEFSFGKM